MPIFLLVLTAAGAFYGAARREPVIICFTIVCTAFLIGQAAIGARVYDGYRHFLFLVPFAMTIAAYPIGCVMKAEISPVLRIAMLAVVTGSVTSVVASMYRLFPYQYSFYNVFVGGVPGADGRYSIEVWRSALREALRLIDEKLAPTKSSARIYSCGSSMN